MKKIKFLILTIILLLPISISAKEKVNIYLFHSETCMHCQAEIEYLNEIKKEYDNVKLNLYEVDRHKDNQEKMIKVKEKLKIDSPNVPFTVIGNYYYIGYSESIGEGIKELIEKYSEEKEINMVKPILEEKEIPNVEMQNGEIKTINFLGKKINPANISLPVLSIILGTIDGFNPCAMWVLIFLISMLFNMKNRKKMWCLGITFLVTSAVVYLIFMFAWLGITTELLTKVSWFKTIIALVALTGAFINLKSFYNSIKKGTGCEVVDDKKRKKIFEKIKKITTEKSFILALLGVMILAASVNVIELACSAGIPVLFTNVLALNNLNNIQTITYILIYTLFFLIDDIIVFVIAMLTLNIKAISTRYTKYSHLIGGILMLIIGLLMLFKPSWLMFNFK
jgi:thiol-disulfide isomerase/thioredoxin